MGPLLKGYYARLHNLDELRQYAQEIVRFCREPIYFDDALLSGNEISVGPDSKVSGSSLTSSHNGINVTGTMYEASGGTLVAQP